MKSSLLDRWYIRECPKYYKLNNRAAAAEWLSAKHPLPFVLACTAERYFRVDRAQEHLHYVTDVGGSEELFVLDTGSSGAPQTPDDDSSGMAAGAPKVSSPAPTSDAPSSRPQSQVAMDKNGHHQPTMASQGNDLRGPPRKVEPMRYFSYLSHFILRTDFSLGWLFGIVIDDQWCVGTCGSAFCNCACVVGYF